MRVLFLESIASFHPRRASLASLTRPVAQPNPSSMGENEESHESRFVRCKSTRSSRLVWNLPQLSQQQLARSEAAKGCNIAQGDRKSEQIFIADKSKIEALKLSIKSKAAEVVTGLTNEIFRDPLRQIVVDTKSFGQSFMAHVAVAGGHIQQMKSRKEGYRNVRSNGRRKEDGVVDKEIGNPP